MIFFFSVYFIFPIDQALMHLQIVAGLDKVVSSFSSIKMWTHKTVENEDDI